MQVRGGASGALIVEGIERANPAVAGLPERVLVIRDQDLLNPDAPPSKSEPVVPKMLIDRDGDAANNGTGFGKPAKDLSINFVPVPYPDYPPASIRDEARRAPAVARAERLRDHLPESRLLFERAAAAARYRGDRRRADECSTAPLGPVIEWSDHIGVPPGARVEFIVDWAACRACRRCS